MKAVAFKTTNLLYVATVICLIYLLACWTILYFYDGRLVADGFAVFFVAKYQGFLAGIPIITLYLISERLLRGVPITIARCISYKELNKTSYRNHRRSYASRVRAVAQSSCYFVGTCLIFSVLRFGRTTTENALLMLYSAALVYCVCYVARKIYHIGRMLESIREADVDEDLFSDDKLSSIVVTVNVFTFAMILSLVVYTVTHYRLSYESDLLDPSALKILVSVPVLLILPVLVLFNFQPRSVVNSLYLSSINKRKKRLSSVIVESDLSEVEKSKRLLDYDKILKDELRYHYRLAFTEAPVVLTIMFSVIALLLKLM